MVTLQSLLIDLVIDAVDLFYSFLRFTMMILMEELVLFVQEIIFVALFGDQGSCMVSCCYGQFFDTHFLALWWRCECCIHKGFLNMFVIGSISAASCTYKSCVFSIFALFRNTCNTFLLDKGFKGHHDIIVCYFRLWKFFCLLHTGHTCQMWLCGGFKSQNSFYRS